VRTLIIALLLVLAELIGVLLFSERAAIEREIAIEYERSVAVMGTAQASRIYHTAQGAFDACFLHTGAYARSYALFVPAQRTAVEDAQPLGRGILWVARRLDAMWASVFRAYQRAALFASWLPYALLLLVPAAVDGWVQRAIKRDCFGHTSTLSFSIAAYAVVGLVLVPFFLLFFPTPQSPLLVPAWAIAASIATVTLASNTRKYA
jgi:hypothetical protein